MEEIHKELQAFHPDYQNIVVSKDNSWLVKGIIELSRAIEILYLSKPWFNRYWNLIYVQSKENLSVGRALCS
jgi:hypothetical protein